MSRLSVRLTLIIVAIVVVSLFLDYKFKFRSVSSKAVPSGLPAKAVFFPLDTEGAPADQGQWVGCTVDTRSDSNWCEVTDQTGAILFQGAFLPVGTIHAAPKEILVAGRFSPSHSWMTGPKEGVPVPVIPLQDGTILVPASDTKDLAARWKADPDELSGLEAAAP